MTPVKIKCLLTAMNFASRSGKKKKTKNKMNDLKLKLFKCKNDFTEVCLRLKTY